RIAAATFSPEPSRWALKLDYGDGIAGRAYKMNRVSLFVKSRAVATRTPFYYVPADGSAVLETGANVPEEALLSFPLAHPDQPETIFGVLNMSSKKASSRLVDITEDQVTKKFRLAVSWACLEAIRALEFKVQVK